MAYLDYSSKSTDELKASFEAKKKELDNNPPPPFAKGKEIIIPFLPRPGQAEQLSHFTKNNVTVCHRRYGKTILVVNVLIREALKNPGGLYGYIAPSLTHAKTIAWLPLKKFCAKIPGIKFMESETTVVFPNGAQIRMFGAFKKESMRGLGFWGVVFDEYGDQPSSVFTEVVGPALIDNDGWTWFIGTPKGKNNFYEIYQLACEQMESGNKKWFAFKETVMTSRNHDGTILYDEKALETYRLTASQNKFEQEMLCSFNATVDGAVYELEMSQLYNDGRNRIRRGIFDPNLDVHTIWDIGMADATAIIFVQFNWKEVRIINYIEDTRHTLDHYAGKIRDLARTHKYHYAEHHFPHDMVVDEFVAGSRLENAREALKGFGQCVLTPKIGINDGIENARVMFGNCYFEEENTEELVAALSFYHRDIDDKNNVLGNNPKHDWSSHAADAFRYLGVNYKRLTQNNEYETIRQKNGLERFLQ